MKLKFNKMKKTYKFFLRVFTMVIIIFTVIYSFAIIGTSQIDTFTTLRSFIIQAAADVECYHNASLDWGECHVQPWYVSCVKVDENPDCYSTGP